MLNEMWRTGDQVSEYLIDMAAGRPLAASPEISDEAFALCHEHGLVGLMAVGSPDPLSRRARPSFVRLAARQRVMLHHLHRVMQAFADRGIRAAVLKGPYLAKFSYRDRSHRTFTDVDVLVHPADLFSALETLDHDSAVSAIPAQGPRADKRNVLMADPQGVRFTLDLHWDLFSYKQLQGAARGATESAWTTAHLSNDSEIGPLWHLPEAARICFLCTHALLDHRFRLILFRDLTEVALRHPDWEAVGRFADRWGLRSSTYISLLMAAHLTEAPIPTEFIQAVRPRSAAIRLTESLLPKTDLVRFDGHNPHPLNLAIVLLHDSAVGRLRLAARAPVAFPNWRRRVGIGAVRDDRNSRAKNVASLVVLVTTDRRRGAEVFGERLTEALQQRGWEAALVALSQDKAGPRVKAQIVSDQTPEKLGRLDLRVVMGLREILSRMQTQVVLANGSATLQYALAASRTLRPRPRVIYASIGEPMYWIGDRVRRLIQRALLSKADLVLAVSESTKQQLVEGVGLLETSVAVAPTGVPNSFFEIAQRPFADKRIRLLFLGNLSREKNPMAAVELANRLSRTIPFQLRFVGEGPLQGQLQSRVAYLNVESDVMFAGSVEDVGPHLAWADLLILTSETEGLPGVVLEAAAAGVPSIAFDVGGAAETIQPGITGELVPAGDIEAFHSVVVRIANDRKSLIEMGQRAKGFVAEQYSLERAVDRYEEILTEQLALGGRRPQLVH